MITSIWSCNIVQKGNSTQSSRGKEDLMKGWVHSILEKLFQQFSTYTH